VAAQSEKHVVEAQQQLQTWKDAASAKDKIIHTGWKNQYTQCQPRQQGCQNCFPVPVNLPQ
jgi:hypothetical protein